VLLANWTLLLYAGHVNGFDSVCTHYQGKLHKKRMLSIDCFSVRNKQACNYKNMLREDELCLMYEDFFTDPEDLPNVVMCDDLPYKNKRGEQVDPDNFDDPTGRATWSA